MAADLRQGSELAGFRIESLVARGGMGVVYRATQLSLEREVALKLIAPELVGDEAFRERFLREARMAASLEHPHVLPVYGVGEAAGQLYLALRYVEGEDLRSLFRAGPLSAERAVRIVTQVAAALEAAHARGLLHRDVKPENVLVLGSEGFEHAYLTDFGLARPQGERGLTQTGELLGSLDYLAPELIEGGEADPRCDLYALGCLLYACLTGEPPFARAQEAATLWAHVKEPVPLPSESRPELGERFDGILERALAKDPGERFQSARELADALLAEVPLRPRARGPAAPSNLPRPASSFVGRERELAEVRERLAGARLLTLTGPGGSGKTRLAIEAASALVPSYEGVYWVGLASLRDPALVTETIAQTLGAKDGLAEHIGDQSLLLLLDNLEHVIEAAPELGSLLVACPSLTLLVTSRELLRVQGEREYPVPPLAEPESVALFCERSQLAPGEEIGELCARLDNLPLAVELAAARAKALTPAQILERLSQRLDLLKGGRDADPRQQTLRATIEWSYELLTHEEQRLFARLSVFAGGCTLEAAEEVAKADLDTLQSLVEKSLLRFSPGRYWMLETIREYAGERLAQGGEATTFAERHAHHFLRLAESAEPELWGDQTDIWLPRLDAEEANFRAALGWSIRRGEAEVAVRLAGALYPFWEMRARQSEARGWLTAALDVRVEVAPRLRAKALVAAGRATGWHAEWPPSLRLLEEAAEHCRTLDDPAGLGRCLGFIGHIRMYTGDLEGAATALDEAVELARSTRDRRSLARALGNAGWIAVEKRDFARAREMWMTATEIARAEGMKVSHALSLANVGYAEALAGDLDRAAGRIHEAAALLDELGETTWTSVIHRYDGLLALLAGRIDDAEFLLRKSLAEGREQAPRFILLYWVEELAAVATAKGHAVRAATLWGATDALFDRLGLVVLEESRQVRARFRGDPGSMHEEASARGRAMTVSQAVGYALSEEDG